MNGYRIYFLDDERRIKAAHWFNADDDETALWIAARLYDACSDQYKGFELWHMARRIGGNDGPALPAETAGMVKERREELLVETEETLRDGASLIAPSRRLLESLERVRR